MRVTLYKNCIVSKSYTDVFDNKKILPEYGITAFQAYLDTLEKYVVNIEDTYSNDNQTFAFEINNEDYGLIYKYNYAVFDLQQQTKTEKFLRYCFIDNIQIKNEICYVSFSIDVWHTYSPYMTIYESYLVKSRKLKVGNRNIEYYNLPVEYDGNNAIKISDIKSTEFEVYCELQFYDAASFLNSAKRYVQYSRLAYSLVNNTTVKKLFNITELNPILQVLEVSRQKQAFELKNGDKYYFEMGNFTIIPKGFSSKFEKWLNIEDEEADNFNYLGRVNTGTAYNIIYFQSFYQATKDVNIQLDKMIISNDIILPKNEKLIAIGTFNKPISILFNGTDIIYKYQVLFGYDSFVAMINIQNQVEDITEDFSFDLPFDMTNGEIVTQQRIAKASEFISGFIKLGVGASTIAASTPIESTRTTTRTLRKYRNRQGKLSSLKDITTISGNTGRALSESGIGYGVGGIMHGLIDIISSVIPTYSNATTIDVSQYAILNTSYFPVIFEIESDNDNLVKKVIELSGYNVFEYVGNEIFENDDRDYDCIMFETINLYGEFPQTIAEELKQILLNGIRLHYGRTTNTAVV